MPKIKQMISYDVMIMFERNLIATRYSSNWIETTKAAGACTMSYHHQPTLLTADA